MLSPLERQILNQYQHHFPLSTTPYADMAKALKLSEASVIHCLRGLMRKGVISRIGPVFQAKKMGASTLVAMAVPTERLETVAALINSYEEVNHNYERNHQFNLWFVVIAQTWADIIQLLAEIETITQLPLLNLPMETDYYIDLGFPI